MKKETPPSNIWHLADAGQDTTKPGASLVIANGQIMYSRGASVLGAD
jgi:hypothetical protein